MKNNFFLRVFYVSLLLIGMNMVCSSCSNEDEKEIGSRMPVRKMEFIGDYVKYVEGMQGILCCDDVLKMNYIEDADLNRYYIVYAETDPTIMVGDKVEFEGKVYAISESPLSKKGVEYVNDLLKDIHIYGLYAPAFSMKLVE